MKTKKTRTSASKPDVIPFAAQARQATLEAMREGITEAYPGLVRKIHEAIAIGSHSILVDSLNGTQRDYLQALEYNIFDSTVNPGHFIISWR